MKKLIIFDADSIIWNVAYKFRNQNVRNIVLITLNNYISSIIKNTSATHYIGFYGSKEEGRLPNFRHNLVHNYKANRPPEPSWITKWRPIIHEEMTKNWGFIPIDRMEADDACAIATKHYKDSYEQIIIATADKDLLQIPNIIYYNYTKHESMETTDLSAAKALYLQLLIGDSADNIKGLYLIGPKKAKMALKNCTSIYSLFRTTALMYIEKEAELRKKIVRETTKKVKQEVADSEWAKNKSDKQIERKARMQTTVDAESELNKFMDGGWKSYYKQQHALLKLLDTDDILVVPIPQEWEKESEEDVAIKAEDINEEAIFNIV